MAKQSSNNTPAQDTVVLLVTSLKLIIALVIIGILVGLLFDESYGSTISGVGLFAMGGIIISFRRIIWDAYSSSHPSKQSSNYITRLVEPSVISYKINILLIWPAVMLIGLGLVFYGVFNNL